MSELTEVGLRVYSELRGPLRAERMRSNLSNGEFGAAMTSLSMEFVFGSVWARDGLDRRSRSLVTIGILMASRQTEELKNHIRIGLTNGLTVREIEEAILQATVYAGFPAARSACNAAIEVLHELQFESAITR
jgi:4-carboxymuconolactone decarboxylase